VTATDRFRTQDGRLAWKMSIDLSYPLVAGSSAHDPLDGLVSALALESLAGDAAPDDLAATTQALRRMCEQRPYWRTSDALGLGGLLFDACRLAQLRSTEAVDTLLVAVLRAAAAGLDDMLRRDPATLRRPVEQRLAFRELGLAIGLRCLPLLRQSTTALAAADARRLLDELDGYAPLGSAIETFWLTPAHREHPAWHAHQHINDVMLATCLLAPAVAMLRPPLSCRLRPREE